MAARMLVFAAMIGAASGCAGAHPQPATAADKAPEALAPAEVIHEVEGAVEQYRQAYEVKSLDALEPLYLHGPGLVLVIQGDRKSGWQAVRNYLDGLLMAAAEIRVRVSDVSVVALGDSAATAVATLERSVSDGTTMLSVTGTLTLVFERLGSDWKIASEHFSYAPKTP